MINISQHAFVPRTKIQKGKIYNSSGNLINSSVNDTFEPQVRFGLNTVYFPQNATSNVLNYKVTYFDPYSAGGNTEIPDNRVAILRRESERIAFGNNYSLYPNAPRGLVYEIAWYQPLPVSLTLNSIDLPTNDLDVEENELI